jgi:hypothetical protein
MRQLHCLIAQVLVFSQVVDPFALAPPGEAGECQALTSHLFQLDAYNNLAYTRIR